jgi:hypothetical protein
MGPTSHTLATVTAFSILRDIEGDFPLLNSEAIWDNVANAAVATDDKEDLEFVDVEGLSRDDPHARYSLGQDIPHKSYDGRYFTAFHHFIDIKKGPGLFDDYDGYSYAKGSASRDEFQKAKDAELTSAWDKLVANIADIVDLKIDEGLNWWFNDEYVHAPGQPWYRPGPEPEGCSPSIERYSFPHDKGIYDSVEAESLARFPLADSIGAVGKGIPYSVFMPIDNLARYWYEQFINTGDPATLGPVMHAIQDISIPHHAAGYLGNWHGKYEAAIEWNIENIWLNKNNSAYQGFVDGVRALVEQWSWVDYLPPDHLNYNDWNRVPAQNWSIDQLVTWLALNAYKAYDQDYHHFKEGYRFNEASARNLTQQAIAMNVLVLRKALSLPPLTTGNLLPFVEQVMVIQAVSGRQPSGFGVINGCMETNVRYNKRWEHRKGYNRDLICKAELPLGSTHEAYVFIAFGPSIPLTQGSVKCKRVSSPILNLTYEGHSSIVVKLKEVEDAQGGRYYWGSFNPSALSRERHTLDMGIHAFDDMDPSLEIDSNPATAAYVVTGNQPTNYEPGPDRNHHVQVAPLVTKHDITEEVNDSFVHAYKLHLKKLSESQERSGILGSGSNYILVELGEPAGSLDIPAVGKLIWSLWASVEEAKGFRLSLNMYDEWGNPRKDAFPDNEQSPFKSVRLSHGDSRFYLEARNNDFACQGLVSYQLEVGTGCVYVGPPLHFKQFLLRIPRDDRRVWVGDDIQYLDPQLLIEDIEGHLNEFLTEGGFLRERERATKKAALLHALGQVAQMAGLNQEAERLYTQSEHILHSH